MRVKAQLRQALCFSRLRRHGDTKAVRLVSAVLSNLDKPLAFVAFRYRAVTKAHLPDGIKNNGVMFRDLSNRGAVAYLVGILLTGFYVCLYWFPQYLTGLAIYEIHLSWRPLPVQVTIIKAVPAISSPSASTVAPESGWTPLV